MLEGKIFGWDLDYTLGNFYPIATNRRGLNVSYDEELSLKCLRKGITRFLEKLCNHNCSNFITTQGSAAYAQEVLTLTGIDKYFEGIFSGEQIDAYRGKLVKPLIRKIGLTEEEARERVLITGDMRDDQPADVSGIVFVFHPSGYRYNADILGSVFGLLNNLGGNNFNRGFSNLYRRGQLLRNLPPESRLYKINGSTQVLLEEQTTIYSETIKGTYGAITVPTLRIL